MVLLYWALRARGLQRMPGEGVAGKQNGPPLIAVESGTFLCCCPSDILYVPVVWGVERARLQRCSARHASSPLGLRRTGFPYVCASRTADAMVTSCKTRSRCRTPALPQGAIANGGPGATPTKHGGNTPLKGSTLGLTAMAAAGAAAEAVAAATATATLPPVPGKASAAGIAGTAAEQGEKQQQPQRQDGGVGGAGWEVSAVWLLAGAVLGAVLTRLVVSRSTLWKLG